LSSSLSFGSTYYDYKAKQNRYQTNSDKYDYKDFNIDEYDWQGDK
jgi:hypothetical protein